MSRHRPSGFRSSLGSYADQMREPDPSNGRNASREMWWRSGKKIAVFNMDHLTWPEQTQVKMLFEQIFGETKGD